MKLDFNCMNDVLLALEDLLLFDEKTFSIVPVGVKELFEQREELSSQYTPYQIHYALTKLAGAGYISPKDSRNDETSANRRYYVCDITFNGHEYIKALRNQSSE